MARIFNSTSDGIRSSSTLTGLAPGYTVSAWFKPNLATAQTYAAICCQERGVNTYNLFVGLSGTGPHLSYYWNTSGGVAGVDPGSGSVSTGTWYHVAVVVTAAGSVFPYLGGVSDGGPGSNYQDQGSFNWTIGYQTAPAGSSFNGGSIADVAWWNVELTALEISALVKGARPNTIRGKNLVTWYPLDGLSSPEPDLSGNAKNGTLTGTTQSFGPPLMLFTPRSARQNIDEAAAQAYLGCYVANNALTVTVF